MENLSLGRVILKCNIKINISGLDSYTGPKFIIKLSTFIFPRTLFISIQSATLCQPSCYAYVTQIVSCLQICENFRYWSLRLPGRDTASLICMCLTISGRIVASPSMYTYKICNEECYIREERRIQLLCFENQNLRVFIVSISKDF